jgi:uncharacterized protein YegL
VSDWRFRAGIPDDYHQPTREGDEPLLLYLLIDASGSTVRAGFNAGCNRALPELVTLLEERWGDAVRICLLSYGSGAAVRVPLTPVADLAMIPILTPDGLSSLASGLDLLGRTLEQDLRQLASDGVTSHPPVVVVLADGLPTDDGERVLRARAALDGVAPPPVLHVAMPADTDALALAGLRASVHRLTLGDAEQVARSVLAVAEHAVPGPEAARSPVE